MMRKNITVLVCSLIVIALLSASVLSQEEEGQTAYNANTGDINNNNIASASTALSADSGASVSLQDCAGCSYSGGVLTLGDGTKVNLKDFKGANVVVSGGQVTINGQLVSGAGQISGSGNTINVDHAGTIVATGSNEEIDAGQVGTFQAGPVVITNGQNVHYENGCVSASSAASLVHTDTVATQLNQLNFCSNTLDVEHADSVWAGCVYMEDVEHSRITAATNIHVQSAADANFTVKDCATNQLVFAADGNDSSLIITRETVSPTYTLTDGLLSLDRNNVTETLETNGTAQAEIHRQNGIEKASLTPVTVYTYDVRDPLQDFSVRAWQDNSTLFLRKTMTQALPAEAATCKECVVVDLPNHRIDVRGVIDFSKNQISKLGTVLKPFFTTGNKDARAQLAFTNDNTVVSSLTILADAPPYKTFISNYLTLSESVQTGNHTERLLGIDEKIAKDQLSTSLLKSYATVYSNATTTVDRNELVYERQGTKVTALPDGDAKIAPIVKKLNDARTALLLPLLGVLAFFPLRRKGQLTIFMVLGLIILIIVGTLLYTAGILALPGTTVRVTDRQQIQTYVTQCLEMSGKQSLNAFDLQGGYLALQQPYFSAPPTAFLLRNGGNAVIALEDAERALAVDVASRFKKCVDDFKVLKGVSVQAPSAPSVKVLLGVRDATLQLNFEMHVFRQQERWDFDTFAASVDAPILSQLNAANSTVQSELLHEGQIDLDTLPAATMTFFPLQKTLLTLIESYTNKQLEPFLFYFANAR
jgi:hypothetical protein